MGAAKKKKKNWLKVIVKEYSARINKGVSFLDRNLGRVKWLKMVNEQNLDMANGYKCMLGQAYGNFWEDMYKKVAGGLSKEQAAERGFYLTDELEGYEESPHGFFGYDILTHLWHCRIVGLKIEAGIAPAEIE